jgi:hypothetical protein
MKNPKCGACKNKITILGSLQNFSLTKIICPFCFYKNKIDLKHYIPWVIFGFFIGIAYASFQSDDNLVNTFSVIFSIISFYLCRMNWHKILV